MGDVESASLVGGGGLSESLLNAVPVTCVDRGWGGCGDTDNRLAWLTLFSGPVRLAMEMEGRWAVLGDRAGGDCTVGGDDTGNDSFCSPPVRDSMDGNRCSNDKSACSGEAACVLVDPVRDDACVLFCGDGGDTAVGLTGGAVNESVNPRAALGNVGGGGRTGPLLGMLKLLLKESPKPVGDMTFWPVNLDGMPNASPEPVVDGAGAPKASLDPVRFASLDPVVLEGASFGESLGGGTGALNESPKPPGDTALWFLATPNASTLLCLVLDDGLRLADDPSKADPCNLASTGLGGLVPLTERRESDIECWSLVPWSGAAAGPSPVTWILVGLAGPVVDAGTGILGIGMGSGC